MLKKLSMLITVGILTFEGVTPSIAMEQGVWDIHRTFSVSAPSVPAYREPRLEAKAQFDMPKGTAFAPIDSLSQDGIEWFKVEGGFWVPALEPNGVVNVTMEAEAEQPKVIDLYGIMEQPHRFAVKMVKMPGAKARIETYKKVEGGYVLSHTYDSTYRKDGPKDKYGDLKSPGGPVIRYLYRTTRSAMNGRDKAGNLFGVYKVSYPMPHDALPYLLAGKMSLAQYNNIPAINYVGGTLYPHPHSMLGADILIHTKNKGSLGCINIENELMGQFYNEDLVTENDKELIPFVIYDEGVVAPPEGQLF
ncbi:hypothetical protein HZA44_00630 [Candidatus Peregrinibacteria bacterium]|nr:hypothetical protein [Candidatus Peregrinibacteria bacterium]